MQAVLTALSDPTHRAALALLRDGGELCVCDLMDRLNASQSRTSRHMKVLHEAGILVARRDARWVRHRWNNQLAPELACIIDAVLAAGKILEEDTV